MPDTHHPPAIILVSPQMGENIGAAARAMGNFGLSELRIVSPRDGWPNPAAEAMAAHALPIVQAARVFTSLSNAVADCQQVYATSARLRDMQKPVVTAREFSSPHPSQPLASPTSPSGRGLKTAILFGRESSGLSNEELAYAHTLLTIPVNPACPSINLAQAVNIVAYEWFQAQSDAATQLTESPELTTHIPAPMEEFEGFLRQLEAHLDAINFWKVAEKKPKMRQNLRHLFLRAQPSSSEVQTLRGIVSSFSQKKP